VASRGGIADYSGITYEKLERHFGIFWPCPADDHPGTPRLFEKSSWNVVAQGKGPFYFPDGKARFNVAKHTPPAEDVDAEYPLMLTTGRVISHFLSGTQTRRIGPLMDHCPNPYIEVHPQLADRLGLKEGDWATAESRRGQCTLQVRVVKTIRPDTLFIPYHWAGVQSANQLTIAAQDPISKIPEYKVCAVRLRKAGAPSDLESRSSRPARTTSRPPP
jgi:assimilatory nitrate reductase catalytic subunit